VSGSSERRGRRKFTRLAAIDDCVSVAIINRSDEIVGAISARSVTEASHGEALLGLARICGNVLDSSVDSAREHEAILENMRDAVIVVDPNMIITYANRAIGIQIGRSPSEVVGANVMDILFPGDLEAAFDALIRLATGREVYRLIVRVLHGSGEYIRLEVTGTDMTADARVGGTVLSLRNGEHDTELTTTLEQTRQLSDALVEQLHGGIIATDAAGSFLVVNQAARQILAVPSSTCLATIDIDDLEFLDKQALPVGRSRHPIRRVLDGEVISEEPMSVHVRGEVRSIVVSGRAVSDTTGTPLSAQQSDSMTLRTHCACNESCRLAPCMIS
jgi:PAS domain S-box-containing protein